MAPKIPHKTLILAEEQEILQKLQSVSGKVLTANHGIGTSIVSDIKMKTDQTSA